MASDQFDGPRDLLGWAKRHLDHIEQDISAFQRCQPYIFCTDIDPQAPGEQRHKIRVTQPLPRVIPLRAFDAVNGLRAALDHAMFASNAAMGLSTVDTKFPFGGPNEKSARDDAARSKKCKTPAAIIDIAIGFRPYETGDETLWGLNQVRNIKHHRFLAPIALNAPSRTFSNAVIRPEITGGLIVTPPEWDSVNQELTYVRTRAGANLQFDSGITIDVAFDQSTPFAGKPALGTLRHAASIVERILMAIEAETDRLIGARVR